MRASPAMDELRDRIDRRCTDRRLETSLRGLTFYRAEAPVERIETSYWPALCVMAQGVKQVMVGERVFQYDPCNYLIATVGMPVTARIVKATLTEPLLSLTIDLDPIRVGDVLLEFGSIGGSVEQTTAFGVSEIEGPLLDAVVRYVKLLDDPGDVAVLGPLIEREILYRLLRGPQGVLLRDLVAAGSRLARIARATEWIRAHYAERISIDELSSIADMSVTSFHRHFKAVTAMSPLQYRTRMRLQEARRLMLVDAHAASTIAFDVGYESVSQFSREYRKMFGMPPAADAARLRYDTRAGIT